MRVSVLDPQTGKHTTLTVIGVLADSAPAGMAGIWTSQATLTPIFGDRVLPTTYLFKLSPASTRRRPRRSSRPPSSPTGCKPTR